MKSIERTLTALRAWAAEHAAFLSWTFKAIREGHLDTAVTLLTVGGVA